MARVLIDFPRTPRLTLTILPEIPKKEAFPASCGIPSCAWACAFIDEARFLVSRQKKRRKEGVKEKREGV